MLKKAITYLNFDDEEVTEYFYFNLTMAELVEMEAEHNGGFEDHLRQITADEDGKQIINTVKMLLRKAIGLRSDDNKRFLKNDAIAEDFFATAAYSAMFVELCTSAEKLVEFAKGCFPKEFSAKVDEVLAKAEAGVESPKTYTTAELVAMPHDEFARVAGTDPSKMTKDHLIIAMQRRNAA